MRNVPKHFTALPVRSLDERLTIYTLAVLSEEQVRLRVETRLERYPSLRRIFDAEFLQRLIPDRLGLDNYLLWRLADIADSRADQFWYEVDSDLQVLEYAGSFDKFCHKFRQRRAWQLESAKTELDLSAWMGRRGHNVILEPDDATGRRCEFSSTDSVPPTAWEVKRMSDEPDILARLEAEKEIKKYFMRFDEPYVLHFDFQRQIENAEVHKIVRYVRHEISTFHRAGDQPLPFAFEAPGLKVTILQHSDRGFGYQRTSSTGYRHDPDYTLRVRAQAEKAGRQLPHGLAGVAVLDTTLADFARDPTIMQACYGESCLAFDEGGRLQQARRRPALFCSENNTNISAVMHYHRDMSGDALVVTKYIYNNVFADIPLPGGLLADPNVVEFYHPPYRLV